MGDDQPSKDMIKNLQEKLDHVKKANAEVEKEQLEFDQYYGRLSTGLEELKGFKEMVKILRKRTQRNESYIKLYVVDQDIPPPFALPTTEMLKFTQQHKVPMCSLRGEWLSEYPVWQPDSIKNFKAKKSPLLPTKSILFPAWLGGCEITLGLKNNDNGEVSVIATLVDSDYNTQIKVKFPLDFSAYLALICSVKGKLMAQVKIPKASFTQIGDQVVLGTIDRDTLKDDVPPLMSVSFNKVVTEILF